MVKDNPNINDILDKVESCKNIKKFYNPTTNTGLYNNSYNPEKPSTKEVKQVKEEVHTEEIMNKINYKNKLEFGTAVALLGCLLGGAILGNEGALIGGLTAGTIAFFLAK